MANDIVGLPHQFFIGEARGVDKGFVEIGYFALEIGLGDDQGVLTNVIFIMSNGKIFSHACPLIHTGCWKRRGQAAQVSRILSGSKKILVGGDDVPSMLNSITAWEPWA